MNTSSLAGHTVELLDRVIRSSLPTDRVVHDFYRERRYLGSHDRKWINEKIYGIVRNFILLRELSTRCSIAPGPLPIFLAHEIIVGRLRVQDLEREYGPVLEAYRLSGSELHVDLFFSCITEAHLKITEQGADLPLAHSFPDFFPDMLDPDVRSESVDIMTSLNHEAKVSIRVDLNRISREDAVRVLADEGITAELGQYSPLSLYFSNRVNLNSERLYKDGMIEVQEEASQLVGLIVDPQEGELIVDACAGAGGKSLEVASLSRGRARIYALDVDDARLRNLGTRAARCGYPAIERLKVNERDLGDAVSLTSSADKVIVDAPCSGSGTIRRNPDKKFRLTRESVTRHSRYQLELLTRYSDLVRPGGILVYSTCSIFFEENRGVVESFIAADKRFILDDAGDHLSPEKREELTKEGFLSIYPHRHGIDGFFAAVLRRLK